MKQLPQETLVNIGSYLNQQEQKYCSRVCKQWYDVFVRLVFAKAVLTTEEQVKSYLAQRKELKALTVSLHLVAPITDETFATFIKTCPKVKYLTLFSNITHKLSVGPAIKLIHKHWASTLTKIRMDTLLQSKLIPLLADQLEDITGDLSDLMSSQTRKFISLPKLKALEIEEGGDLVRKFSASILTGLRKACPALVDLTINDMQLDDDISTGLEIEPFSFRSLHLKNCNSVTKDIVAKLLETFCDLKEFSALRADRELRSSDKIKANINDHNRQLRSIAFDYNSVFEHTLQTLTSLRTVHLEFGCELATLVKREKFSLSDLLEKIPQARNLTIYGNAHLVTTDGLEHYLIGKIGSYDDYNERCGDEAISREEYRERFPKRERERSSSVISFYDDRYGGSSDDNESVDSIANEGEFIHLFPRQYDDYERFFDPTIRKRRFKKRTVDNIQYEVMLDKSHEVVASQGEILMDYGQNIVTTKRKHAMQYGGSGAPLTWDTTLLWQSKLLLPLPLDSYTFRSSLSVLKLQKVTLRNPTYRWINACCPLLTELHVLETDLYPLCEVYVKDLKRLNLVSITFDKYYCENLGVETVGSKGKFYSVVQGNGAYAPETSFLLDEMKFEVNYKITVNHSDTLNILMVGGARVRLGKPARPLPTKQNLSSQKKRRLVRPA